MAETEDKTVACAKARAKADQLMNSLQKVELPSMVAIIGGAIVTTTGIATLDPVAIGAGTVLLGGGWAGHHEANELGERALDASSNADRVCLGLPLDKAPKRER